MTVRCMRIAGWIPRLQHLYVTQSFHWNMFARIRPNVTLYIKWLSHIVTRGASLLKFFWSSCLSSGSRLIGSTDDWMTLDLSTSILRMYICRHLILAGVLQLQNHCFLVMRNKSFHTSGDWGEYLDLRGTGWQGNGESCITRSWMICTPYPILCGW